MVLLDSLTDPEISALLRADEPEEPVCLLAIFPSQAAAPEGAWWARFRLNESFWEGMPSPAYHGAPLETYYGQPEVEARPIIAAAREASRRAAPPKENFWQGGPPPRELSAVWKSAGPLRPLIHNRRSAQGYNPEAGPAAGLPLELFYDMMRRVLHQPVWFPWGAKVQPFIFVHRIAGLPKGLYLLQRLGGPGSNQTSQDLRTSLDPTGSFIWEPAAAAPDDVPLVLLRAGDVREEARLGSCVQDIASDSAFSVAFLAEHLPALQAHGAWWCKFKTANLHGSVKHVDPVQC